MASAVIMPRQGQSVESCILTEWYKSPGDPVDKGDLLFAYETDKAAFEQEAPESGIFLARFFEEGDEVPVLVNVGVVGAEGEDFEAFRPRGEAVPGSGIDDAARSEDEAKRPAETISDAAAAVASTQVGQSNTGSISPRARNLAKEKRVVLEAVRGSGPGGRIIERDVLEAIRQGKRLTPLAQKKKEAEGKGEHYHSVETYFGSFERSFHPPQNVKTDKVEATFDKGVLKITLPKTEEAKKKEIKIKVK